MRGLRRFFEAKEQRAPLITRHDEWGEVVVWRGALGLELTFGDTGLQGRVHPEEPWVMQSEYAVSMSLAAAFVGASLSEMSEPPPQPQLYLLGLGTGALAWAYQRALPSAQLRCVELRRAVVEVARVAMRLDELPNTEVIVSPAERDLKGAPRGGAHLIAVDLFLSTGMAPPLASAEFWSDVERALHPQGVLCVNLWSSDQARFDEALKLIAHATLAPARSPSRALYTLDHLCFSNITLLIAPEQSSLERVAREAERLDELSRPSRPASRREQRAAEEAGLSGEPLEARVKRLKRYL